MFTKSISLVIPVYNEAEIIEETLLIFVKLLSTITSDFEIIVVNDGSNDGTDRILNRFSFEKERIKVFHNERNIGSGASLWRGFQEATKELVLSNFADRPFNLSDLEQILPLFKKDAVDFIVVARKDRSANNLYRKITSYANFLLIRFLFNIKAGDFQFVQIYKRKILENIDIMSTGTFVPPELIVKLISQGYKFKKTRCVFHRRPKGKSKCGSPQKILRTLREMFKFWFHYKLSNRI